MGFQPGRCLLQRKLKEIKKSQQWLSEQTGMSKARISDYVNTRKIMSLSSAKTIAHAIGCQIDDLYEFPEQ